MPPSTHSKTSCSIDAQDICAYSWIGLTVKDLAMQTAETTKSARKPTNLSLDSALLKEAKSLGINVSRSAEAGIAEAVKRHKREKWLKENAAALASSNAYVEANGLPLAQHRQF